MQFDVNIRPDDYLLVACFVAALADTIISVHGLSRNGLGQDAWRFSPETLTTFLCYLFIGQVLYATVMFATKICVALLFLRIFPVAMVQRLLWATIGVCALSLVLFDVLAIVQCQPISLFWTGWDQLHEGHCLEMQPLAYSIAGIGIVLDVWMLAIPIWQLMLLQMKWQRKVAVALMLFVGTFVTIVSVLRLRYLVTFGSTKNPTWDSFSPCYWSAIEVNVGIWCACMPDLRLLLLKTFPILRSNTSASRGAQRGSAPQQVQSSSGDQIDRSIYRKNAIQIQREASSSETELVEMGKFRNGGNGGVRNHSRDDGSFV
ncbi:hypothetical protein FPOAC2_12927 [Fusarium poae]|uniref:hypothetical protein n=1 Tax=Fusarium poae TaxID=36050 RepID=UPI001CEAAB3F|nr:hypothetical protein FPOAC1_012576 [Fusarium poae]KAG8667738.1 hypothetical protein FPOAC1_012576 [Fusarium poae]